MVRLCEVAEATGGTIPMLKRRSTLVNIIQWTAMEGNSVICCTADQIMSLRFGQKLLQKSSQLISNFWLREHDRINQGKTNHTIARN